MIKILVFDREFILIFSNNKTSFSSNDDLILSSKVIPGYVWKIMLTYVDLCSLLLCVLHSIL
jgi:hypothetical protein